jgi:hypothetical protein
MKVLGGFHTIGYENFRRLECNAFSSLKVIRRRLNMSPAFLTLKYVPCKKAASNKRLSRVAEGNSAN